MASFGFGWLTSGSSGRLRRPPAKKRKLYGDGSRPVPYNLFVAFSLFGRVNVRIRGEDEIPDGTTVTDAIRFVQGLVEEFLKTPGVLLDRMFVEL
jgi:hypothetical protein